MTLEDFANLQTDVIANQLKEGKLDFALADADCMDIIMSDPKLQLAASVRLKEIFK